MSQKKYKLTDEKIQVEHRTLYRIEAVRDFWNVRKGDKGGYIEKELNLSHEGHCWVSGNACVYEDAMVLEWARVKGNARVSGRAKVYGNARVYDNARVQGDAVISDHAEVYGEAKVYGMASVSSFARVYENARVGGKASVFWHASVCGDAEVWGSAEVRGMAEVDGYAIVCGNAEVEDRTDYIVFNEWWSSGMYFTWTRSNDMWAISYFIGTAKELIKMAYEDSEKSGREYERIVRYVESVKEQAEKDKQDQ